MSDRLTVCTSCDGKIRTVDGVLPPHGCPLPAGHPDLELTDEDVQAMRDLDLHRWLDPSRFERLSSIAYARPGRGGRPRLSAIGEERLRMIEASS